VIPPFYAVIYQKLCRIALRRGWALAIHGSVQRDIDLVLIPWVDDADHEDTVVEDIRLFIEGSYNDRARKRAEKKRLGDAFKPRHGLAHFAVETKPHGRRAISIYIGYSAFYLDISIMPRQGEGETK
jgi:dissimilatory sulfite reductase (desulfoviridin) alpha/beta subunit